MGGAVRLVMILVSLVGELEMISVSNVRKSIMIINLNRNAYLVHILVRNVNLILSV